MSDEAMAIVRALAATDPFALSDDGRAWRCVHCAASGAVDWVRTVPRAHAPGCLWVRAVALVYPATGGRLTATAGTANNRRDP
jgi:hypothetical protein